MRHLITLIILLSTLACGGGSGSTQSTPPPPPPPPPTAPVLIPAGTYRATPTAPHLMPATYYAGSAGTLDPIFIVTPMGEAIGELPGWQQMYGGVFVAPDGTLSPSTDALLVHPDGTSEPLTVTGTLTNGRMVGTSNAGAFDLTIVPTVDMPWTITDLAGTYISTSTSSGLWGVITIAPVLTSGNITGTVYASQADAQARANPVGTIIYGTIVATGTDAAHVKNCFQIGFQTLINGAVAPFTVSGFATFNGATMISLCSNTANFHQQWSGTFAKQ